MVVRIIMLLLFVITLGILPWRRRGVTIFSIHVLRIIGGSIVSAFWIPAHTSYPLGRIWKVRQHTDKLTQTEIHTTCIRVKAKGANTLAWPTSADRTPTPRLRPRLRPIVSTSRLPARIYSSSCVPYAAMHPMNMISDFSREIVEIPRRHDLTPTITVSSQD